MTTKVTKSLLADNSVGTDQLENDAVTSDKLANDSVATPALQNDSVTQDKLANNSVGADQILNDAITGPKYADNSLPLAAIADGLITGAKLANASINTDKLGPNSVTSPNISSQAVTTDKVAISAITSSLLANDSVVTSKVANNSLTYNKLQTSSEGTLITYNGSNQAEALPIGDEGETLIVSSGKPAWGTPALPTGTILDFFGTTAPSGWIIADGSTIGSSNSGADYSDPNTKNLYFHLWNNFPNNIAPVSTGRGGSAQADWDANKTMTIPDLRGRTTVGVENLSENLSNRISTGTFTNGIEQVGNSGGDETIALTASNLPDHRHHTLVNSEYTGSLTETPTGVSTFYRSYTSFYDLALTDIFVLPGSGITSPPVNPDGSTISNLGSAHNNMQPSILVLKMIKL